MPSKIVTRFRSKIEPVVSGSLETAAEVAAALAEVFDGFLEEGETRIDWTLLQKLISRRLASKGQRLGEVDSRLEVNRSNDKQLRQERNRALTTLQRELRSARFLLDESFGRELAAEVLRWRRFSRVDPAALVALARETAAKLLTAPSFSPKRADGPEGLPQPEVVAAALERRALEVEGHLEQLAPKRKRETFEVGEKSEELQEAKSAQLRSQDLLFGLYRAAGKDHLASRLRPKARTRSAKPEAAGGTTPNPKEGGSSAANPTAPAALGLTIANPQ